MKTLEDFVLAPAVDSFRFLPVDVALVLVLSTITEVFIELASVLDLYASSRFLLVCLEKFF